MDNIEDFLFTSIQDYQTTREAETEKKIRLLYINAQSLRNKLGDFRMLIDQFELPEIICVTETWIHEEEKLAYYLNGYKMEHVIREGQNGGGIVMYIRSDITTRKTRFCNKYHSLLEIEAVLNNSKYYIICMYNPRYANAKFAIEDLEEFLASRVKDKVILVGDFNINLLDMSDDYSQQHLDLCLSYGLQLKNTKYPTRETAHSRTLIDHIFTSIGVDGIASTIKSDFSDHHILIFTLQVCMPKSKKSTANNMIRINYAKANNYFSENQFVCNTDDANKYYEKFVQYVHKGLEKASYTKAEKGKEVELLAPWVTPEYINLCKRRNTLYNISKRPSASQNASEQYKQCRNKTLSLKRKLQREYYAGQFQKVHNNPRDSWKLLNELVKGKSDPVTCNEIVVDGEKVVEEEELSLHFNKYYVQIAPKLAEGIQECTEDENSKIGETPENTRTSSRPFNLVTNAEVYSIIDKLKHSTATVHNNISSNMLKKCNESLHKPITKLVNLSLQSGVVPDELKISQVTPIFKSGSKTEMGNYRPISVQSPLAKVLEACMKMRLVEFLEDNNYFSPNQYGFRTKSSTLSAVVDITSYIQSQLDKGRHAAGLFIDLKKAFDTVDHRILITKLKGAGLHPKQVQWFRSYLTNRKQYVKINCVHSELDDISCGVPQGSILGPILYLIYVNDIQFLRLFGRLYLFADDTALVYEADSVSELYHMIQEDLKLLCIWFKKYKLTINIDKTVYIVFSKKNKIGEVTSYPMINGKQIQLVENVKYLGLIIDNRLTWEKHVAGIRKKIATLVGLFYKLNHFIPDHLRKQIYFSNFHSHFLYLMPVWSTCNKTLFSNADILHKRALKCLYNLERRFPTEALYQHTLVLPLQTYVLMSNVTLIFKLKHHLLHSNVNIEEFLPTHTHATRHHQHFVPPRPLTTKFGINGILYKSISAFRSLPPQISTLVSLNQFKLKLKIHFLSYLLGNNVF